MQRTIKALITAGTMAAVALGTAVAADAAIVTSQASLVNGQLTIAGSGAVPQPTSGSMTAPPRARPMPRATSPSPPAGSASPVASPRSTTVRCRSRSPCRAARPRSPRRPRCPACPPRWAGAGHVGHRARGALLAASGDRPRGELPVAGEHHPGLQHPGADRDHGAEGHLDHAERPRAWHLLLAGPVGELPAGAVLPAVRELDHGEFPDDHRGSRGPAGDPPPAIPGTGCGVPSRRDVPADLDRGDGSGQLPAADVVHLNVRPGTLLVDVPESTTKAHAPLFGFETPLFVRVFGVAAGGTLGLPSPALALTVTFHAPVPPAPSLLTPTNGATVGLPVQLSWTPDPNPQVEGYQVEINTSPNFGEGCGGVEECITGLSQPRDLLSSLPAACTTGGCAASTGCPGPARRRPRPGRPRGASPSRTPHRRSRA